MLNENTKNVNSKREHWWRYGMVKMTRPVKHFNKRVTAPQNLKVDILTQDKMEAALHQIFLCFQESMFSMTEESLRELFTGRRYQGKDDSLARWYIAKLNKEIVGVLLLGIKPESKIVSLGQFAVKPQFRGRGIGRYLTFRALSDLQRTNADTVILFTHKDNKVAIRLYEGFGFTMESTQENESKHRNEYNKWLKKQVETAIKKIAGLIPSGESFILVDEGQWNYEIISEHRAIPFLERNGMYWGPPPDDKIAIQEFDRLHQFGANFIVFGWQAFWWLDFYSIFHQYLKSKFRCVLQDDHMIVFDLRS